MSFMGGSKGKQTEGKPAFDPRLLYHGNPRNMDPGFRTPFSQPLPEHLRQSLITSKPVTKDKNSLISSRMR